MKNFSFQIATNIINLQMKNETPNCSAIMSKKSHYKFMLLDKQGKKINGDKIDNEGLIIKDSSPLGHLGVWTIVVEDSNFNALKQSILYKNIAAFWLAYFVLALLGYYLIKLLLKPTKEARERIDRFVKDTTHELNTPITALLMCTDESSLQNRKTLERIKISAQRVSELYKDLTYIFLEDRGSRTIYRVGLKELIEQQMSYFSLLASKKRLTLSCKLDSTAIQIDKDDFKRLFSNLLSNSIKYNKKGGSIKITLKSGTLTITDSGIGIEQKEIKNIFKRYYRATDESGGFGLGLSIAQEICKRYNIDLKVQSKPGVRTIFRLHFHTY